PDLAASETVPRLESLLTRAQQYSVEVPAEHVANQLRLAIPRLEQALAEERARLAIEQAPVLEEFPDKYLQQQGTATPPAPLPPPSPSQQEGAWLKARGWNVGDDVYHYVPNEEHPLIGKIALSKEGDVVVRHSKGQQSLLFGPGGQSTWSHGAPPPPT